MGKNTIRRPDEAAMSRLLAEQKKTAAGLILRLAWWQGLTREEIQRLTWDDVSFPDHQLCLPDRAVPLDRGVIHLPDRDLTLGITLRRLLRTAQNRRREGDDPHVLLAPNSRRPIDQPRLSKLVRTALIRGGLETVSLGDLCREERREGEDARLLVYAAEKGAISRSEAMSILGLSKVAAYERLRQLTASGRLVRVGTKYYPAGQVVPPEEQYGGIREFLTQSGPAYRQDLAALLHIGDRQCALILKHMVEAGRLVRTGQRYVLPVEEKAIL